MKSPPRSREAERREDVEFWLYTLLGMVVMIILVVLLGPGLWSSRVDIHKADDKTGNKDTKRSPK
jgi:hypothetical protein